MPPPLVENRSQPEPEVLDIPQQEESIKFHDPAVKGRIDEPWKGNGDSKDWHTFIAIGALAGLAAIGLLLVTFLIVRNSTKKSSPKKKSDKRKSDKKKSDKKTSRKSDSESDSESEKERRRARGRKQTEKKRKRPKSSTSSSSVSVPAPRQSSHRDPVPTTNASSHHERKKAKKIKKPRTEHGDERALKQALKMAPLSERRPNRASSRAINRQLEAQRCFEDKLKTLREGSERERMLRALREIQVTTHWPDLKTEDLSSEELSLGTETAGHQRTALSPFIKYKRPRLMKTPSTAEQKSKVRSCEVHPKRSYYRYKEGQSQVTTASLPVLPENYRMGEKLTPKALDEFFNMERLAQWQKEQALGPGHRECEGPPLVPEPTGVAEPVGEQPGEVSPTSDDSDSSESLKLIGANKQASRRISDDESYVMYSRDGNFRRNRARSILHARPTPPESSDEVSSPPTPAHVRRTLAGQKSQSRTVRFDRFTKRYLF